MLNKNFMNSAQALEKYHRLSNYISTAMLYLKENVLLETPFSEKDIKKNILGHWGTVPGLNLIYGGLNYYTKTFLEDKTSDKRILHIVGPGHGAPAILTGIYLEGTLQEYYPEATLTKQGLEYVAKQFSWPSGFPSHTWPGLPGQILEGGELGYSLATAFGAAQDNPNMIAFSIVGDGEAETGTIAASWQLNKFMNHKTDGVVVPILHLNGYRISGPSLFNLMTDEERKSYFTGLGYDVLALDYFKTENIYADFIELLNTVNSKIETYKSSGGKLPLIILKTPKGWTGPKTKYDKKNKEFDKVEGTNLSHGIPISDPQKNEQSKEAVREWLESYKVSELYSLNDDKLIFDQDILELIPTGDYRIAAAKFDKKEATEIRLPNLSDHAITIFKKGDRSESRMAQAGQYLRDVFVANREAKNFLYFSPDESESNMQSSIYNETGRKLNRQVETWDEHYSQTGRIIEILSENALQAMFEGYVKTGRHGILISYEAFLSIITSQLDQFAKYIKQSQEISFRKDIPSINLISTSVGWRQDHNGFTHQNPGLINSLLTRQSDLINVHFPIDTNTLLVTLDNCLNSKNRINLIIACKRHLPEWLSLEEAKAHVKRGISTWEWASNGDIKSPDVIISSAGDYVSQEALAACQILKNDMPEINFSYVNVNEMTRLGFADESDPLMLESQFEEFFPGEAEVIMAFHGYPEVVKQVTWGTSLAHRIRILGYIEEGSTTTPFDMMVVNKISRYHILIEALMSLMKKDKYDNEKINTLLQKYSSIIEKHKSYIIEHGNDIDEVKNFTFDF